MQLRTRFIIAITATLTGFLTISALTFYLIMGINRLNRADAICNDTVNTLKQFQLVTSRLLTTHELDKTFIQWEKVYQKFQDQLDRMNTSQEILEFLEAREKENIINSLNMFWVFTQRKTAQVEHDLSVLLSKSNQSQDGLIYQYSESKDHRLLVTRNAIYNTLLFLEAEFEIKLTKLITIVDQEKTKRFNRLIFQISAVGLVIGVIVSTILISFLVRLRTYLGKLHQTMEIIGQGDFTKKLHIPGEDELSRIALAINKTTDALSDIHNELEKRINENFLAKEKAEAANKTKSIFLANISHEIRTPLNAVIGFSELLASLVTDKKQKSYLAAIQKAGKTLLTLINDILDVSKIEADKLEIQYAPFNLRGMLDDVEQVFSVQASKKNIAFHQRIVGDLPDRVILDEIRLRQVFLNIVGNAVKFTDEGHITLSVEIIEKREPCSIDLHISITDTGMGIPEEEQDRIFNSFEQQSGQDNAVYGGTGLGLTISKSLVELMNGKIWVESSVNTGSSFHILFRDVAVSSDDKAAKTSSMLPKRIYFEKSKVLVVDNEKSHRRLMASILAHSNLDTQEAANGREAIDKALAWKPDLILMDLRMPILDGTGAAGQLKQNPFTAHIPVIAVTASSSADIPCDAKNVTRIFDGCLSKPIVIDTLMAELARYLEPRDETDQADLKKGKGAVEKTRDYSKVVRILETDFLSQWQTFKDQQPMAEVKLFGERVKSLGIAQRVNRLKEYGDDLIFYVENFDVFNMQATIDEFPNIIKLLSSQGDINHAD